MKKNLRFLHPFPSDGYRVLVSDGLYLVQICSRLEDGGKITYILEAHFLPKGTAIRNHDCDFSGNFTDRNELIANLLSGISWPHLIGEQRIEDAEEVVFALVKAGLAHEVPLAA